MGCFLVTTAEAVATTIAIKVVKAKEKKLKECGVEDKDWIESEREFPLSRKLGWLNKMLWGGSALLAFEHIWHGEIGLKYPFLTAMRNQEEALVMLQEMSTAGVGMALIVTVVWGIMMVVFHKSNSFQLQRTCARDKTGEGEII